MTSPLSWEAFQELGPVALVALLGGLVAFYRKVREGAARPFNFTEFLGEMLTSAVAGVLAYWACNGLEVNPWLTAAIVGIAGHAGSRALFIVEKAAQSKYEQLIGTKIDSK